jgi:glycosyltransferase involved in cell wall biosynthesis
MHTASDCRLFYANTVYERLVARICDFLDYRVAISRYDRIVLLTEEDKYRCWNNNKKAIVIPNPLIINHTKRSMLDRKVVLSVGKLTRGKNFAAQIRSWAKIHSRYPDWKLAIVGDGEEKANLDTLIRQLQLTDCVDLIGAKDDISDYMAGASVFVSTSLSEGFGLVIIEAMSFGIPVVSYDCPCGPKDIISDGIDGFLVPTGNEQMLTEKICCLIEHDDMRKRMGGCALKSVERFSMDVIVGKWLALFKDLMASKQ